MWLGLIASVNDTLFIDSKDAIIAATIGYLVPWLIAHIIRLIRGQMGMGHGDFKMLAAIGAWFGLSHLFMVFIAACMIGVIQHIVIMIKDNESEPKPIAFGPAIAIAAIVILLTMPIINQIAS